MSNTFVVNGKTYNSLEEMPPEVRAQFESMSSFFDDKDKNGMPDLFDNMVGNTMLMQTSTIVFDGKTYKSIDEMPPEGRAAYEKAMGQLKDENRDGIPDVMENAFKSTPTAITTQMGTQAPHIATQTTSGSSLGPVIVLGIVAIGLALAVGILLFLLLNR